MSMDSSCKICGIISNEFCRSCGRAYYCSKEHQKKDWKKHKHECIPVKSVREKENGRQLIATRNIRKGELILSELPIFITPNTRDPYGFTCLGCCNKISAEKIVHCSQCGWALCSYQCEKEVLHAENECRIFTAAELKPSYTNLNLFQKYCEIGVLRMLLTQQTNLSKWTQLTLLDDFIEFRQSSPDCIFDIKDIINFIRQDCKQPFSDDMINKTFGILRANAFDTSDYTCFRHDFKQELKQASLIFPNALIPGPNCVPNVQFVIAGRQSGDYILSMIAAIDISIGHPVSIPYEDGFSGTFLRQEVKRKVFFQNCTCKMCRDPTELGTFLSSPKCSVCKNGYYVPSKPLEIECYWNCRNCSARLNHSEVVGILQKARVQLYECMNNTTIEGCFKAFKNLKTCYLHPNHFLMLQTESEICCRILTILSEKEVNSINPLHVDILIGTSKHILSVADIIRPGYNRTRGRLLYCLQYGLLLKLLANHSLDQRLPRRKSNVKKQKFNTKKQIEQYREVQEEAHYCLKESKDCWEEQHMLKTLSGDLQLASETLSMK